jgi:hypothetical protein
MDMPIDVGALPPAAQKLLDAGAPLPLRQMAARGIAPGLKPADALTVLVLLSESDVEAIATTARATLDKIPPPLLNGALGAGLPAAVIDVIAPRYARDAAIMEKILMLPTIASSTVAAIAVLASEPVSELIAVNEQRMIEHPAIIEKLYMNKATRMSTADRIIELAVRSGLDLKGIPAFKEAAAAIANELIAEPTLEPTPDDILFRETDETARASPVDLARKEDTHHLDEVTGEEIVDERFLPLHTKLAQMSVTQKIRRAQLGTASERLLLVRDKNRLVASSAIRSPKIQENEVLMISTSRNISDEVLRIIASNREWTQSHQIKLNLVMNPRTPFVFSAKLIGFLREHELKALAKSKNVSGAIAQAARQHLNRKGK